MFSTRLMQFEKEKEMALGSQVLPAVNECRWGHALFGETRACTLSTACAGHDQTLVRGKPGSVWPCWGLKDASTMTEDLVPAKPTSVGYVRDRDGDFAPMYLMGYMGGESVYRTTNILAIDLEGTCPGSYQFHEPALFPNVLIAECGPFQADITVRTEFCSALRPQEGVDFHQAEEFDGSDLSSCGEDLSSNVHGDQYQTGRERFRKYDDCQSIF